MKRKFNLKVLILEVAAVCLGGVFLFAILTIQSEAQTSYATIETISSHVKQMSHTKQMLNTFEDELEEEFLIVQEKDFKVEY